MSSGASRVGPTAASTERPRSTNPRSARTRATILVEARQLLARDGEAAFSYAELAKRLGMTRQTIYRYWPRREDLLRDLAIEGPENYFLASSVEVRPILLEWLRNFAQRMARPEAGAALLRLLHDAETDPRDEAVLAGLIDSRRDLLNQLLAPSGYRLTSEDFSLLMGPVTSRRFLARAEITDAFLEAVVDQFLARPTARVSLPGTGPGPYPVTGRRPSAVRESVAAVLPPPYTGAERSDDVRGAVSGS